MALELKSLVNTAFLDDIHRDFNALASQCRRGVNNAHRLVADFEILGFVEDQRQFRDA